MVRWLKEYEYVATWLGFLLAIIALLPLRQINWASIRPLSLLLALLFTTLAIVFLYVDANHNFAPSAGAAYVGCTFAAIGFWRRVLGRK
jgi:hypothetical protein